MMSRYFDKGRVYRPVSGGISVGIYDEEERVLVIQRIRLERKSEESEEDCEDIGLLFEDREDAAEYFEMALRAVQQ